MVRIRQARLMSLFNIEQGEDRLVAAVGVNGLVIVDTGDAVLVADRGSAQDVKQVVDQLVEETKEGWA